VTVTAPPAAICRVRAGVTGLSRDRRVAGEIEGTPGRSAVVAKAVERCVAAHRACLREPEPTAGPDPGPAEEPAQAQPEPEPEPEPAGKFAERARRHHQMVHELLAQGHGIRTIARHLGWGRHTVQRYARAATWQELVDGRWQGPHASKLDPFKPHLRQRIQEGCGNVAQLFREIGALGYPGSYSTVRDYLDQHRPAKTPLPPAPPTVRDVTGWLTRHPENLTEDERPQLKALLARCTLSSASRSTPRMSSSTLPRFTCTRSGAGCASGGLTTARGLQPGGSLSGCCPSLAGGPWQLSTRQDDLRCRSRRQDAR
jgi:hypothetical protein